MATSQEDQPTPIRLEALSTVPAISALGLVAARMLQQHGLVTLMVAKDGVVEVVADGELQLDIYPERDALSELVLRGYTDQQLEAYMQQREVRLARRSA